MPTGTPVPRQPDRPDPLGRRIARLRVEAGFTQGSLAERVGISRVALGNLEAGRAVAGERTVVLLAGTFGMEPPDLVAGTDYPRQKAERLPLVAARHTEVDLWCRLVERDLSWTVEVAPVVARARLGSLLAELLSVRVLVHDLEEQQRLEQLTAQVRRRWNALDRPAGGGPAEGGTGAAGG